METENKINMRKIGVVIAIILIIIAFISVILVNKQNKDNDVEIPESTAIIEEQNKADEPSALEIDGISVLIDEKELDWRNRNVLALVELNDESLPNLEKINLGHITVEELAKVNGSYPNAQLLFETEIADIAVTSESTSLDLSELSDNDYSSIASVIELIPSLREIKLGDISLDEYKQLFDIRSDISYDYSFELFGKSVNTLDEELKYKKTYIGDEGLDALRDVLPYMPKLTYLSLDRCETSDEATEALNMEFPDKKIVWRIFFNGFSCMTDAEKIWAIGCLHDEDVIPLQYCHDIKYLDLGHNDIKRIDFVKQMPKLEVLILGCGNTEDISALEGCTTLEYLEITSCEVSDLSPLASCVNLKHFEMSITTNITDISPLYGLELERFHALYEHTVPIEQYEEYARLHPDCDLEYGNGLGGVDPYNETDWRYNRGGGFVPRYELLREQIGYDDPFGATRLYSFLDNDEA